MDHLLGRNPLVFAGFIVQDSFLIETKTLNPKTEKNDFYLIKYKFNRETTKMLNDSEKLAIKEPYILMSPKHLNKIKRKQADTTEFIENQNNENTTSNNINNNENNNNNIIIK